ncbi:hypothetical protein [Hydrogenophaga sp. BPS33]|uniref:hypothetical protein n=1 Tax=Hydrogenophaga sp. BPS33 TaxID=2651974 RepID=UPI0013202FB9|nr:hypothetical protein [Hydrogenophaga sp. BPS33]QHE86607.1 hypothetical protein F9K07_17750 [Hydrogenophaga sp. BPS33]
MNGLYSLIRRSPKATLVLGKTLLLAGAILIVGAVFARADLMNLNAERAQAQLPALKFLAEAYPQYPTWLVPETALGFTISGVLVVAGMLLVHFAEKARSLSGR